MIRGHHPVRSEGNQAYLGDNEQSTEHPGHPGHWTRYLQTELWKGNDSVSVCCDIGYFK